MLQWYVERAENNIIIIGQDRVWDYTWVKKKYPWWTDKCEEDRRRPEFFDAIFMFRSVQGQAQIELREAMIMLRDGKVE